MNRDLIVDGGLELQDNQWNTVYVQNAVWNARLVACNLQLIDNFIRVFVSLGIVDQVNPNVLFRTVFPLQRKTI